MILRRLTKHVNDQNWFAVFIDFRMVVFGVYIGVWIGGFQESRSILQKQRLVVEALRQDMIFIGGIDEQFRQDIDLKFEDWTAAYNEGQQPPPVIYRLPGSDTAPQHIWNLVQQNKLSDLFSPDLLNDLGLYYSELDGVARKYVRYIEFVEAEILPGLKEDKSYFYRTDDVRLIAKYEASMDRLREYRAETTRLTAWSSCLAIRLEKPVSPSGSCTPDLASSVFDKEGKVP
jgi:hypothetical protein